MRILVTGGAGFIASHVTDAFVAAGHQVAVVDDLSSGKRENLNPAGDASISSTCRTRRSPTSSGASSPEVLCHHAAQMDVRRSVADPVFDARVNILGLLNLLENGRQHGLQARALLVDRRRHLRRAGRLPVPGDAQTEPLSPYGVAKLASERYLFFYSATYGISYAALRYANVYGPRQNPHGEAGVVAIFAEKLLRGEQPVINGDGKQTRDYVYVGDLVRANLAALTRRLQRRGQPRHRHRDRRQHALPPSLHAVRRDGAGAARAGEAGRAAAQRDRQRPWRAACSAGGRR